MFLKKTTLFFMTILLVNTNAQAMYIYGLSTLLSAAKKIGKPFLPQSAIEYIEGCELSDAIYAVDQSELSKLLYTGMQVNHEAYEEVMKLQQQIAELSQTQQKNKTVNEVERLKRILKTTLLNIARINRKALKNDIATKFYAKYINELETTKEADAEGPLAIDNEHDIVEAYNWFLCQFEYADIKKTNDLILFFVEKGHIINPETIAKANQVKDKLSSLCLKSFTASAILKYNIPYK